MAQMPEHWFVPRGSKPGPKAITVVETVDDLPVGGYAHITVMHPDGKTSHYGMPIAEYEESFAKRFRRATPEDVSAPANPEFRAPKNSAEHWTLEPEDTEPPTS